MAKVKVLSCVLCSILIILWLLLSAYTPWQHRKHLDSSPVFVKGLRICDNCFSMSDQQVARRKRECTVSILPGNSSSKNSQPAMKYHSKPEYNNAKTCQWKLFRNYYLRHNYFPDEGHWELRSRGYKEDRFVPGMCQLDSQEDIDWFLLTKDYQKIVTLGDSIGKRYFQAILGLISSPSMQCVTVRQESMNDINMPDIRYFMKGKPVPDGLFRIKLRTCYTCGGRYVKCQKRIDVTKGQRRHTLTLEHIPLTHLNDTTLTTTDVAQRSTDPIPEVNNTVEFYFRSYLRKELPDVLIIIPPFVHERAIQTVNAVASLNKLIDLVRKYIPRWVKVVWMPQTSEWKYNNSISKKNRTSVHEKNCRLNEALFRLVKPSIVDPASNWYGFYDLQSVNCPLSFLTKDGLHMDQFYYVAIMKHLLFLMGTE